jgi:predicted metal-dependent peptidase
MSEKNDAIVPAQSVTPTAVNKDEDYNEEVSVHDILAYLMRARGVDAFYANMLSRLKIREDRTVPSIMGVTWDSHSYLLLYNPDFAKNWVMNMEPDDRIPFLKAVVAHECMHILLNHIPRMARMYLALPESRGRTLLSPTIPGPSGEPEYTIQNVATDCAVNENLKPSFPNIGSKKFGWYLPEVIGAPEKCTSEQYAELLLSKTPSMTKEQFAQAVQDAIDRKKNKCQGGGKQPGQGQPQKGKGNGDGMEMSHEGAHDNWASKLDEMPIEQLEALAQELEQEGQRLVNEVSRQCGNVPGEIQEILSRLDKEAEVPWHRLLRNQIVNKIQAKYQRSMQRSNRRSSNGACIYPGRIPQYNFRIIWGIDESGSMSDEALAAGLVELQSLVKQFAGVEVTVVEFDCTIHRIYEMSKKSEIKHNAVGRGGTSFDPFFEYVEQEGVADFVILFTDGFAPAPQTRPRVPLIWCLTGSGECPCPEYGRQIRITEG